MKKRISKKDLARVKELDLLTYFMNYDPDELVKNGRTDYVTRTHSSLHLSNGLWKHWASGRGGKSALDYLVYIEEYSFLDAALYLLNLINNKKPNVVQTKVRESVRFKLPYPSMNNDVAIDYLVNNRKIDKEIVTELINQNMIYECGNDHSVIFVGYDEYGIAKYAMKRSTNSNDKKDIFGSSKEYSFSLSNSDSDILHIFESSIDLLSYLTLSKMDHVDYKNGNYLSLSGVGSSNLALNSYLRKNGNIKHLFLHLDNDEAGNQATSEIINSYKSKYYVFDKRFDNHKDINDYLQSLKNL